MFHPLLNRFSLTCLYAKAMLRAFLRYRNPRRRAAGRHQTAFYEQAWKDAAAALGGSWRPLASGISEITVGDAVTRVCENTCAIDDPVTLAVLSDKLLTYRLMEEQGLATPPHAVFSLKDTAPAVEFLLATDRHCVVKPLSGTGGGRGVTTGIRTRSHLARAAAVAAVYCDELLIEQQVEGDNYRLLYLDGELIDAFVRRSPSVVADGKSTVAQLVKKANDNRLAAGWGQSQVLLTVDLDMRRTLARQGLSLRSVPETGRCVAVKTVVNENCGQDNATAVEMLCPSIIEDGARAARACRVRLSGVDIITTDPSVPLKQSGGVILEVNAPPNYYYHYHKRDGQFPVAIHVLRRLLIEGSGEFEAAAGRVGQDAA